VVNQITRSPAPDHPFVRCGETSGRGPLLAMNTQLNATNRLTGAAAVAGPTLLLASTVAYLTVGDGLNDGELGGALQLWAFVGIGLAVLGLARTLERSVPRTAALLSVLAVLAPALGGAFGIDSMQTAVNSTAPLAESSDPTIVLALLLPGPLVALGLALLGVTLARHGAGARGWLLAAGAVLFPMSRIPDVGAIAILSDLLLVASMGSIGLQLLTGRGRSTQGAVPAPVGVAA
jgi:hypothetical protein